MRIHISSHHTLIHLLNRLILMKRILRYSVTIKMGLSGVRISYSWGLEAYGLRLLWSYGPGFHLPFFFELMLNGTLNVVVV